MQAPIDNPVLRPRASWRRTATSRWRPTTTARKVGDWRLLPGIGKTGNGLTPLGGAGARLEYAMTLTTTGPVKVTAVLSPRNNVRPTDGLKYAISLDDQPPQTVNITTETGADDTTMNRRAVPMSLHLGHICDCPAARGARQ